ncbi:MAG: phage Gp37/Gp68 family protein [Chloroflexota bacterium]
MARSGIEWTESTWNPLTGCTKISPGCKHCYAGRMAKRLQAMGQPNGKDEFGRMKDEVRKHAHWHQFQVLTKRSERLAELSPLLEWAENIWMGVSVENKDYVYRIDDLRRTGARIKFLSVEPLLGPLPRMNLRGINWVIVGGESGPGARPLEREWVVGVRDQCRKAGVPFFFKQWGGVQKKKAGRLLDGRTWDEMPREMGLVKA